LVISDEQYEKMKKDKADWHKGSAINDPIMISECNLTYEWGRVKDDLAF